MIKGTGQQIKIGTKPYIQQMSIDKDISQDNQHKSISLSSKEIEKDLENKYRNDYEYKMGSQDNKQNLLKLEEGELNNSTSIGQACFSEFLYKNQLYTDNNLKDEDSSKSSITSQKSMYDYDNQKDECKLQEVNENQKQLTNQSLYSKSDLSPSKFKLASQLKNQSQSSLFQANNDQSRSISLTPSSKKSHIKSSKSISNSSFSSKSSSSSESSEQSINNQNLIDENSYKNSISSKVNNESDQESMRISIDQGYGKHKKKESALNQEINKNGSINNQQQTERLSIFSSQNIQKKDTQKNSIVLSYQRNLSQSSFLSIKQGDVNSQQKRINYTSQMGKESQEFLSKKSFIQDKNNSFSRSELYDKQQSKKSSQNNSLGDVLQPQRRKAIKNSIITSEKFFKQMQKQSELFMNVFQLENPSFDHAAVQKFFKDTMKKINKTPKEKNLIRKILEKFGVFEKQKDIIFKNQNTNDTLFNNLSIEEFDKHQVIFHIGEFGHKYYIIVSGSVHLLLPQMDGKEAADSNVYVTYMNSIQSGYHSKNEENDQQDNQNQEYVHKFYDLKKCNFFIRTFIMNQNKEKIAKWVQDIGDDEKKITLLFGGLDHEKRLLINASFLNGKEYVNIFYPKMDLYKTFKPGDSFGEIALLTKQRRTATIICAEKTCCLTLTKQGFDQIIGAYQKSMIQAQLNFLQQFSWIEKIPKSKLLSIIHDMKKIEFQKGQIIYKEGDLSDFFYFTIEGEFEISKIEIIKQPTNLKEQFSSKLPVQENDCLTKLNWTQRIKKEKNETKRLPIVILQSNQYFGQNEIIRHEPKRQTRAICLSLSGAVYQIPKNILLYHLNNWNGLEELKAADQIINNWSYNRINQIIEIKKLRNNKFSELWKNPIKLKKKRKQIKQSASFTEDQQLKLDSVLQKDNSMFISDKKSSLLSPHIVQSSPKQSFVTQMSPKNFNFDKIENKNKSIQNSVANNVSTVEQIEILKPSQQTNKSKQEEDQKCQQLSNEPQKPKRNTKKLMKNVFQLFLPSLSLPANKDKQKEPIVQEDYSQVLLKSHSQNLVPDIDQEQKQDSLSPSAFSKFKKYHEKRINDKVLQLIEEQKQVDRRKSELIQNLIEDTSNKSQRSNSFLSDSQKSRQSLQEIQKSQKSIDGQQPSASIPSRRKDIRQSVFFNSSAFNQQQKSLRDSIQIISEDIVQMQNHDISIEGSKRESYRLLQPSISQILSTEKAITSKLPEQHTVNKNILTTKSQPYFNSPPKIISQQIEYHQNKLSQTKLSNDLVNQIEQQKLNQLQQNQSPNQFFNKSLYTDYYHNKPQIFRQERQTQRQPKQIANKNSIISVSNPTLTTFHNQDMVLEEIQKDQQDQLQARHEMCKQPLSQQIHSSNNQEKMDLKELSRIRKQKLLERVYINTFYNKKSEQSINNENSQYQNLDPKAIQLKELMETSPRIAYKNMSNVLNFKKKFLKILSSQPSVLQKKLFDFRSNEDKYVFRKLRSSNRLALNKLFIDNNFQPENFLGEESIDQDKNKQGSDNKIEQMIKGQANQIDPFLYQEEVKSKSKVIQQPSLNSSDKSIRFSKKSISIIRNPMDQIKKIISQPKKTQDSSYDSIIDKIKLETSVSQMSNQDFKSIGSSFFQTPRKNYSFQNIKRPNHFGQNSISQAIKVIDNSTLSCFKSIEIPNDLSILPEGGIVKKINILSQRSQRSVNVIQKNFQNQFSHLIKRINPQDNKNSQLVKQENAKSTQIDNYSFEYLDKSMSKEVKQVFTADYIAQNQKNQDQRVSNINFSTNQKTGETEDKEYIISSLSQRKTLFQRIKEQQIKQKGIQSVNSPKSKLRNIVQTNSLQQFTEDANKTQLKLRNQSRNTKLNETSQCNLDMLSNLSPIATSDKIYLFQNISPSRVIKRHS